MKVYSVAEPCWCPPRRQTPSVGRAGCLYQGNRGHKRWPLPRLRSRLVRGHTDAHISCSRVKTCVDMGTASARERREWLQGKGWSTGTADQALTVAQDRALDFEPRPERGKSRARASETWNHPPSAASSCVALEENPDLLSLRELWGRPRAEGPVVGQAPTSISPPGQPHLPTGPKLHLLLIRTHSLH